MNKPRVLVDVDDTLSATQDVLLREVNARLGTDFKFEEMTRAHREKEIEGWATGVRAVLKDTEAMATCIPFPGALEALGRLSEIAEPHIVSSRQEPLHAVTEKWLADHGFIDHIEQIHPRPVGEPGTEFKVRIAQEQRFEAAFDDTFEVAVALAQHVEFVHLIDQPWNRGHDDELPNNVLRVSSFADGVSAYVMLVAGCPCVGDPPCHNCPLR